MTYELAKKLKDVGFPQRKGVNTGEISKYGFPVYVCEHGNKCDRPQECTSSVFRPILEELIEECGKEFVCLRKSQGDTVFAWMAESESNGGGFDHIPTGAVANLWLKINKK